MRLWLKHRLKSLTRDEGVVSIEFALLAMPLMMILMFIVEYGILVFLSVGLEGATTFGSRLGKTGNDYGSANREDFIRDEVLRLMGPLLDESKLRVQAQTGTALCATVASCRIKGFVGNERVIYQTSYDYHFFTPLIGKFFDDPYTITALTPVTNEPN